MYKLFHGDVLEELKKLKDESVDLFFTSPPYADRRKKNYSSIPAHEYVEWFLPIGKEVFRVMKPSGSFFLNIKAHKNNGERALYVMKLVIALKEEVGFRYPDEFAWTKNGFMGKFYGSFKNAWEPIHHFTKAKPSKITFNPKACATKMKESSKKRYEGKQSDAPKNQSGMTGMNNLDNYKGKDFALPSNVIHINNVSHGLSRKHPATFPVSLAEFFVKSFTDEKAWVCDPFNGSGSSAIATLKNNRNFIGIDNKLEYIQLAEERIKKEINN